MKEKEEDILAQIEEALLSIVTHKERPEIMFVEIDTGGSDLPDEGIIPFLNIYGSKVWGDHKLDEAIKTAIDQDEFGYIVDVLDPIASDDFEIRLPALYPDWPEGRKNGDKKIIDIIQSTYHNNQEKFKHVKKLYFHYVDQFDFVKFIDQPA